eukprot:gene22760-43121_t
MSSTQQQLLVELPDGWSSRIDIKQTTNGRYAGVAELSLLGLKWGVLVFMQQPSLEAALARVRLRASQCSCTEAETKKPAQGGLLKVVVNSHAVHGYGKFSLAEATCYFSRRSDFDAPATSGLVPNEGRVYQGPP